MEVIWRVLRLYSISPVPGSGRRLVNQVSERVAVGLLSQPQILFGQALVPTAGRPVRLVPSPSVKFGCSCPIVIPHAHGASTSLDAAPPPCAQNAKDGKWFRSIQA